MTESTSQNSSVPAGAYAVPGMPPLDMSGRATSAFEFWPAWLIYLPVVLQWLAYSIRYGSITVPLLANPRLHLSGMAGVAKSELLAQAESPSKEAILTWFIHTVDAQSTAAQATVIDTQMAAHGFALPAVFKPEIGCRGIGVKLIKNAEEMHEYINGYPEGAVFMVQQLADWEPEAGVFYTRLPGEEKGKVISLGMKYSPHVLGDGKHSLRELLVADPRTSELMHLYVSRHADRLDDIIPAGQLFKLVFSVSHSKGAIFRNGNEYITPELSNSLDRILSGIPEFYYGRLDVKFRSIEDLMQGDTLQIIEINTASSEPLHIWDRQASWSEATRALLYQYRLMFKMGVANRKRGYKTPGVIALLKGWRKEMQLAKLYPENN